MRVLFIACLLSAHLETLLAPHSVSIGTYCTSAFPFFLKGNAKNSPCFVKIILLKSDNCALALRKRLFCVAKQPLLPCKTYAFGTQNNRFCNALIKRLLHKTLAYEKYLHTF
ncbi:hypothetical protein CUC04_10680 [Prevotella intermedia]|uniref:Uncharacterized protein n=1 Tax=Prevotella intermedia TaxID=28131 RepID=A0A2G9IDG8_PREIN|nr:hypothetical protein CUC04_10680 [Prevotella intermedia]